MAAAGEKGVILTRAARIKCKISIIISLLFITSYPAGMLPPTPLFSEPHSRNKADHKKKSQSLINNSSTRYLYTLYEFYKSLPLNASNDILASVQTNSKY